MKKRGQITFFILVGVIILVVVGFLSFVNKDEVKEVRSVSDLEKANLVSFVENCNEIVAAQGAYYIAAHNGYYQLPAEYTEDRDYTFTYVYQRSDPNLNVSLSLDEIKQNYEEYIRFNLHVCTNNLKDFEGLGADIDEGQVIADVEIQDNKVLINTIYDIKVQLKDSYYEIYELKPVEIPVRLGLMYGISQTILQWILDEPDLISSKYINELMNEVDMDAYIDAFDDTSEYVIRDIQSSILNGVVITDPPYGNKAFDYVFGAKFD